MKKIKVFSRNKLTLQEDINEWLEKENYPNIVSVSSSLAVDTKNSILHCLVTVVYDV
jgi:hypothetical protein